MTHRNMNIDRRRTSLALALVAAALTVTSCGGGSDAGRLAHIYAAGIHAAEVADYDRAIADFRALGRYRDAPTRLAAVRQAAAQTLLTRARQKLSDGHPRAAVALAQTAITSYGDTSAPALNLLTKAQLAQNIRHTQQLALFRAHPELVHHHPPHYTGQPGDKTPPPPG